MSEIESSSKVSPRKDLFPQMESVLQEHSTGIKVFGSEEDEVLCLYHYPPESHRNEDKLSTSSLNIIEKLKKHTSTNDIPIDIINVMDKARIINERNNGMNKEKVERFKLFRSTSSLDAKRCSLCFEERNKLYSTSYASTEKTYSNVNLGHPAYVPKNVPLLVPKNNYVQQMQPLIEDKERNDCQQFQNYQNEAVLQQQEFVSYHPNQCYENLINRNVGQSSPMMSNYHQEYVQSPGWNGCYQNNVHQVYNAPAMMYSHPPLLNANYNQMQPPVGLSYNGLVSNQNNYHQVYGSFAPQESQEMKINYYQTQPVNTNIVYQNHLAPQTKYVVPPLLLNEVNEVKSKPQIPQAPSDVSGRRHHQVKNENSAYKLIMKPIKEDVPIKPKKSHRNDHNKIYSYEEVYHELQPPSDQEQQKHGEYDKNYNRHKYEERRTKKIDNEDSSNDDYEVEVPKKHYRRNRCKKTILDVEPSDEDDVKPKIHHHSRKVKNCPRYEGNVVDNDVTHEVEVQKERYHHEGRKEKRNHARKSEKIQNQEVQSQKHHQSRRKKHTEIHYESKKEKSHLDMRKQKESERKDVQYHVKKSIPKDESFHHLENIGKPLPEAIEIKVTVDPKFIRRNKKRRKSIHYNKDYGKTSMNINQDLLETKTFSDLEEFYSTMEVPRIIRIETNKNLYKDINEERLKNNNAPLIGLWYHNKLFEKIPSPRCRRSSKYPIYYKASRSRTNYVRDKFKWESTNLIPISLIKSPSSEVYSDFDCSSLTSENQEVLDAEELGTLENDKYISDAKPESENESEEDDVENEIDDDGVEEEVEEEEVEEDEIEENEVEEDEVEEGEVEEDEVEEDEVEEDEVEEDEVEDDEIEDDEISHSAVYGSRSKKVSKLKVTFAKSLDIADTRSINEEIDDEVEEDSVKAVSDVEEAVEDVKIDRVSQQCNVTESVQLEKIKKTKNHRVPEMVQKFESNISKKNNAKKVKEIHGNPHKHREQPPKKHKFVEKYDVNCDTIQSSSSLYDIESLPTDINLQQVPTPENKNVVYTPESFKQTIRQYVITIYELQNASEEMIDAKYEEFKNACYQMGYGHYFETYQIPDIKQEPEDNLKPQEYLTQANVNQEQYLKSEGYLGEDENLRQENLTQDNLRQDYLLQEEILKQEVHSKDLNLNTDENQTQVVPTKPTKLRVKKSRKSSKPVQKCGVQERGQRICNQSTNLG
ncbi:uncharacterized protein [Onthophagus taurus]|uniref:uncharacterized protein n=1 Tax=Onthophagus taurus TaxID=166361 RepID=UPI0039BE5BCB